MPIAPLVDEHRPQDGRIYFASALKSIVINGNAKLTGFAIAGANKKFVRADATINGDTIVVSSRGVAEPQHVRYGWAWNPIVNLYNKEGLPAITFRTDE